jgi:hypothetical protein
VPHHRVTKSADADLDVRIESVTINGNISSDIFAKPK